ncbi:MAG: ATP-binding cassette domain-containing protein [Planctomycetaceae bacterium]
MSDTPALDVAGVSHRYGERLALDQVTFQVGSGEVFGLLGPNGGGKTTLFKLLGTLMPLQQGTVRVFGADLVAQQDAVRSAIGVTFQSPSLDAKLTVGENLKFQGYLYGLSGRTLQERIDQLTEALGIRDRLKEIAEKLSGGLKRRVEIAKSLLHHPRLLLLDEPSTGLDPGARHDLWKYLRSLRDTLGVTVLVTTHLMDEADRCHRLGILNHGRLIALGTPAELRAEVGGDCITIESDSPEALSAGLKETFGLDPQFVGGVLRIEQAEGHHLVRDIVAKFPDAVQTISLGRPTLEDVFIRQTGHRFWDEAPK